MILIRKRRCLKKTYARAKERKHIDRGLKRWRIAEK